MNLLKPLQQLLPTVSPVPQALCYLLWQAAFAISASMVDTSANHHRCQLLVASLERIPLAAAMLAYDTQGPGGYAETRAAIQAASQHARRNEVRYIDFLVGQYPHSDAIPFALQHYGLDLRFWQLALVALSQTDDYDPYTDRVAGMLLSAQSPAQLAKVRSALGMEHGLSLQQVGCYLQLAINLAVAVRVL